MALLESRRSIEDARAVSKLTELAFFFIPLTFAASLFGMQIEQLENRAPLSTFIALAVSFIVFSYLVRLIIRSTWLRDLLRAYEGSIMQYTDRKRLNIQRGHVPAFVFLQWLTASTSRRVTRVAARTWSWLTLHAAIAITQTWKVMRFSFTTMLLCGLILAGPLAALWTQNLSHGIQATITTLLFVVIFGLVVVPFWHHSDPEIRSALPRLLTRLFRWLRTRIETARVFTLIIVLAAITLVVVSLALIWTRPLATGIKAATTVVIVLTVAIVFISYGIHRMMSQKLFSGLTSDGNESDSDTNTIFWASLADD